MKTNVIVLFGSAQKLKTFQNFSLRIYDSALERTDSFKYLGVTINQCMTWHDHISTIAKKVNQRLGVLRRVKHMLPLQARVTLYNSLVLPLLDYGNIVGWGVGGDKNSSTLIKYVQTLQNKAAKIILDHHPQSSATEALDSLGWKPLHLRRRFHRCTTILKCLQGFIDFNFHFVRNSSIHNYNTRSRDDFHLPLVRTNWGKQRFIYQSVVDWNSLSQDTRDTPFFISF